MLKSTENSCLTFKVKTCQKPHILVLIATEYEQTGENHVGQFPPAPLDPTALQKGEKGKPLALFC